MKIFNKILYLLLFSTLLFGQDDTVDVQILVLSSDLKETENVYIVGNQEFLGYWDPSKVKMTKINKGEYSISFKLEKYSSIEFKFTLGSWDREALDENSEVPENFELIAEKDTVLVYNIKNWAHEFVRLKFNGQVTGNVKYYHSVKGNGLVDRDVIVWLPPSYENNSKKRYPVFYMHDGQNLFDPATASFGIDWQVDEAADSLMRQNKIEEMIIVGIYNTKNRSTEYINSPLGYTYMQFVVNQLKPMIDSTYRTKTGREFTYTGGSSAGALISFMLLWEHNNIFSKALCFSPAFKIEKLDYVSTVEKDKKRKNIKVYIANGGVGLDALLQPGLNEMIDTLLIKGYDENKNFWVNVYPNDAHNETFWAKRIPFYLNLMFGK